MSRERRGAARKRRTREHIVADLGVHHVEGPILRCGFTMERILHDYGLDLYITTYAINGEAESDWILFQVKATDHLKRTADGGSVLFRVERIDLNRWLAETYPVILVVYDAQADVGYWLYVQAHFADRRIRVGTSATVTAPIPATNVLDEAAIRRFAAAKAAIQRQKRCVMNSPIRYADLWALLRQLGYNCDRLVDDNQHRVCEQTAAGSLLTLADYPPDQSVHPQTLYGVRLELDNFGLLSRAEFDRWVDQRTKANAAMANGNNGTRRVRETRKGVPGKSP